MARLGMDVDEVESVGRGLKSQSHNLQGLISQIDSLVQQAISVWDGNDAHEFHGWWTSQHKPALTTAMHAIDGLGQAALNNATAQREVSSH